LVRFWSSELLPATAELEPLASVLSGMLPKLQLDSSELGSAVFDEESAGGTGADESADGPGVEESDAAGADEADSDGPDNDELGANGPGFDKSNVVGAPDEKDPDPPPACDGWKGATIERFS
jgi:hypothetical protein